MSQHIVSVESSICFFIVSSRDLFVCRVDPLTSGGVIMRTEQSTKCLEPLRNLRAMLVL